MKREFLRAIFSSALIMMLLFSQGCSSNSSGEESTVFFKVAETDTGHGESFIVGISDPELIAAARQIINDPDNSPEKIIEAKIVLVTNDEKIKNKDLNNDQTWSWKVEEVLGFTSFTIEILDGWPGYVEEDPERWFQNTAGSDSHGFIGFWSYTVVAEVDADLLK